MVSMSPHSPVIYKNIKRPSRKWSIIPLHDIELLISTVNNDPEMVTMLSPAWVCTIRGQYRINKVNILCSITKIFSTYTMRGMWKGLSIPYKNIPLYINDSWPGIRIIAKWRLLIGR